jgi:hypothetical protein
MATKQVAQSLKDMAASEAMTRILDRRAPIDDLVETLLEHWSYDLYTRKPGPAYFENGALQPTDLDLACFLSALVDRRAVISLPHYEARRAKTTREGEHIMGNGSRHGSVMGLTANKEVFSFSVRVNDMSVVTAGNEDTPDTVGAPRNFMLVDIDGKWHDGWSRIEFLPSAKENAFLHDKKLWTGNTVVFKNFVHPNRWVSFYGQYYFMTKALITRLEEEATFRRAEQKRLLDSGVTWPHGSNEGNLKEYAKSEKGESKPITVSAFEAEIDAPWRNAFLRVGDDELLPNRERVRALQYNILPRLRFATRATEMAYSQAGETSRAFPSWIKNAKWEPTVIGRTEWNRLVLTQLMPGQKGFALRCRNYEKTERVAA